MLSLIVSTILMVLLSVGCAKVYDKVSNHLFYNFGYIKGSILDNLFILILSVIMATAILTVFNILGGLG